MEADELASSAAALEAPSMTSSVFLLRQVKGSSSSSVKEELKRNPEMNCEKRASFSGIFVCVSLSHLWGKNTFYSRVSILIGHM